MPIQRVSVHVLDVPSVGHSWMGGARTQPSISGGVGVSVLIGFHLLRPSDYADAVMELIRC